MSNEDLWKRFQACSSMYRASRFSKFRTGHVKLVYSKLIEFVARALGIGIKRNVRLFWGHELTVVYPEPTSLATSRYGFYEEGLTTMVQRCLKPGMTFLDVGAHIGYFTLFASWLVGGSGQVHSFEPTPSTFELLRVNTVRFSNVYLNQVAVTSESGTVTLNDYGPAFSGYNSLYQARMPEAVLKDVKSTKFEASSITIDEYVAQQNIFPDFVKIDAESSELSIIRGMEQTLWQFKPMISIEVGDMGIGGVIPCRDLVMNIVNKGYHAYEFNGCDVVMHQPKDLYEYDNILFLPKSEKPTYSHITADIL